MRNSGREHPLPSEFEFTWSEYNYNCISEPLDPRKKSFRLIGICNLSEQS